MYNIMLKATAAESISGKRNLCWQGSSILYTTAEPFLLGESIRELSAFKSYKYGNFGI